MHPSRTYRKASVSMTICTDPVRQLFVAICTGYDIIPKENKSTSPNPFFYFSVLLRIIPERRLVLLLKHLKLPKQQNRLPKTLSQRTEFHFGRRFFMSGSNRKRKEFFDTLLYTIPAILLVTVMMYIPFVRQTARNRAITLEKTIKPKV